MTGKKKWIAIAGLFVVTFVLMFFLYTNTLKI